MNIPIMLVSDAVTAPTGLARITRELATRIHSNLSDTFELCTVGYGGTYSRKFPWKQYTFNKLSDWTIPELPMIYNDFCGDRKGILLWIWNSSWLPWLADPSILPEGDLKRFLQEVKPENWIYCPIDSECIGGKLPESQAKILKGFERVLAYTRFGADVINRTCDWVDGATDHLPHGVDDAVFYPRDRKEARACFIEKILGKKGIISDDVLLLGVCATNTSRKDWYLAFEVCGELLLRGNNVGLLVHTDAYQKGQAWDLMELSDSFGMRQRTIFTNSHLDDDQMACWYAVCNCTLGIGSGEGWGYPLSESLAVGIPVIHGNYAGGTDFVPREFLVDPVAYRGEGYYCNRRPVFNSYDWADKVLESIGKEAKLPDHLYWKNAWKSWEEWFLNGVR